jgi:hypothetical protein
VYLDCRIELAESLLADCKKNRIHNDCGRRKARLGEGEMVVATAAVAMAAVETVAEVMVVAAMVEVARAVVVTEDLH